MLVGLETDSGDTVTGNFPSHHRRPDHTDQSMKNALELLCMNEKIATYEYMVCLIRRCFIYCFSFTCSFIHLQV